jgi:hypothetical protein
LFYILTYSQYQPLTHFIPQACLTSSRPYGMTVVSFLKSVDTHTQVVEGKHTANRHLSFNA